MSLRKLCKETSKQLSKALLFFQQEMTTGIVPTRLILDKSSQYKEEGSRVTVNWEGKKIQAEILALDGKSYNLSTCNCSVNTQRFCSVFLHEFLAHYTQNFNFKHILFSH